MNRRAFLLTSLLYLFFLSGLATLRGELLALTLPLLVYLGWGLLSSPGPLELTAEREISAYRIRAGDRVSVKLTLSNRGGKLPVVIVEDDLPPGCEIVEGKSRRMLSLGKGETIELEYQLHPRRGYYNFQSVSISASDPLGIFTRKQNVKAKAALYVHPRLVKIDRLGLKPRQTNVYAGYIPARVGGPGVEFFGLREYEPGDPIRWINWRASARYQQALYVNQYQQERVGDIGLILDTRASSQVLDKKGEPLFGTCVRAAGSLADRFLQDGNRVGLLLYGTSLSWTFPQYGKVQRQRILDQLARAEVGSSRVFEKLENLPAQILPRKAQLVFVSPLQEDDLETLIQLVGRGYAVMVISPDPVRYEWEVLAAEGRYERLEVAFEIAQTERRLMISRLRQAGVRILDWNPEVPLRAALKRGLGRPVPYFHRPGISV